MSNRDAVVEDAFRQLERYRANPRNLPDPDVLLDAFIVLTVERRALERKRAERGAVAPPGDTELERIAARLKSVLHDLDVLGKARIAREALVGDRDHEKHAESVQNMHKRVSVQGAARARANDKIVGWRQDA